MTYFVGHRGKIKMKRKSKATLSGFVNINDVNTTLNRFGFDGSGENLITGDKIFLQTTDARKLDFIKALNWPDNVTHNSVSAYVNVNQVGGVRLFKSFKDAVNNVKVNEYTLETFTGAPIVVTVNLLTSDEMILGDVSGYTFNTDREGIDVTSLSDKFKRMHSAGLISGGGSIDCLFSDDNNTTMEHSLLMLQLINRIDLGSDFSCILQLTDYSLGSSFLDVFYEFDATITRSGVEVRADALISCAIDFVTTGEIKLVLGKPSGYTFGLLQEDLTALLTQASD
jgi:hypothetical protein